MCSICNISNHTTVGSVVRIVRRCNKRTKKDKGQHLAVKRALVVVKEMASRGDGFYGNVVQDLGEGKLGKTNAHFRDCEFEPTEYKWVNGQSFTNI